MRIYSLYSKSLGRYNLPFFADDDASAIERVAKMVTAQADPSLMAALDDLRLDHVGAFNQDEEFPCEQTSVCIILDRLHTDLPLPPTVKAAVDKFYGGKLHG